MKDDLIVIRLPNPNREIVKLQFYEDPLTSKFLLHQLLITFHQYINKLAKERYIVYKLGKSRSNTERCNSDSTDEADSDISVKRSTYHHHYRSPCLSPAVAYIGLCQTVPCFYLALS